MTEIISKKYSFKGYRFYTWLNRNKNTIKILLTTAVGVTVFFIPAIKDPGLSAAAAAGSAAISKLIVDSFDFWISEVTVKIDDKIVEPTP